MAGAIVDISMTHNLPEIQARMNEVRRRTGNLSPALKNIGEGLVRSVQGRFRTETDPDGLRWKPVKAATRKRKRHPKVLTESHRLRQSIVYRAGRDRLLVGTNVVYAAAHQFGDRQPRQVGAHTRIIKQAFGRSLRFPVAANISAHLVKRNLPARPFLGISAGDRNEIAGILGDYLTGRA